MKRSTWVSAGLAAALILWSAGRSAAADPLPAGFVYLRDIVPDIRQDIRYAGRKNFLRKRVPGYAAGECVLTEAAAKALGKVQNAAVGAGYSLVVFDCYRPRRAVEAMVAWVGAGRERDPDFYPNVPRSELIRQGYIGAKSSHSRGSTVDLALETLAEELPSGTENPVCRTKDPGTLDFGTPFDCFDPASRTASPAVPKAARDLRRTLVDLMARGGFRNYAGEWWHFTLRNEPYPDRSFDFTIERR